MLPAIITTLLWSYCLLPARQSIAQIGENAANFWRLLLAVVVTGAIAQWGGLRFGNEVFGWFFVSGIVGFGFGDLGTFFALPRIGSRLTLLMAQCGAAPLAGLAEWLWLGTRIHIFQILAITVILFGTTLALFPEQEKEHAAQRKYTSGILFGLLAALGQSMGAVFSRKAFSVLDAGTSLMQSERVGDYILLGTTAGYERLLGGILIVGSFWLISRYHAPWQTPPQEDRRNDSFIQKTKNVFLHAATGPILGIICFQWALATTPSAIVQPIVAMTPLVVMPMTYYLEGDRPTPRAISGTVTAVAGVILLACA